MSLSGGSTPLEESIDWTDSDSSSSEDESSKPSFCRFLSPVQEPWATESRRMPMGRGEQIHDNSEQLCELPIVQVVDVYLGSHYGDSLGALDLPAHYQSREKYLEERASQSYLKLDALIRYLDAYRKNLSDDEDDYDDVHHDPVISASPLHEDPQASTSASPHVNQVSHQEHHASQAWPWPEDNNQFPEITPRREDDLTEVISQETDTEDSLSVSSGQSTEGGCSSLPGATSCLKVRSIIHWFRKRVLSSLRRRRRPDAAYKDPGLPEARKHSLRRGKRIQPQ